jgi:hypothetical protein
MNQSDHYVAGGCLCGQLRYEAEGEPLFQGYCCCADCRKASGSGFISFMGFASSALSFTGETQIVTTRSARGSDAVRNFCPVCGSLVFGGIVGQDDRHTIYAGTLDDPARFHPNIAIFTRDRPNWVMLPPGLKQFEAGPD